MRKTRTLKELKEQYGKDLNGIKDFQDLKDMACNFLRQITWKKEKDLDYISRAFYHVMPRVIKDILENGYMEALKKIKNDNLQKAYNINYTYNYYGLNYKELKALSKENNKNMFVEKGEEK